MGEPGATIIGLRRNGEEFTADAAISRLEVGGEVVLTVALRDITEQKRAEGEQRFLADIGALLASSLTDEETLTKLTELTVRDLADICVVEVVEGDELIRGFKAASRDRSGACLCDRLEQLSRDRMRPGWLREVLETRRPILLQRPSMRFAEGLGASEIYAVLAVPLVVRDRLLGAIALLSLVASRLYGPADVRFAEEIAMRVALSIENARLYLAAQRATQARDDLLGVVAHDLRNPLNSILIATSQLHRAPGQPEACARIQRSAKRMSHLIGDLLDVTCMESGALTLELEKVNADQVVSDSIDAHAGLANSASLDLRQDASGPLTSVWADPHRLMQVFENLIGNAIKFTPAGGRISVGAAHEDGEVRFWVSNTGGEIAAEDMSHLFDRFWQGNKTRRHGAGLGLPIAKGIVEAHHGRIWVRSSPGEGTTFSFTIPVTQEPDSRIGVDVSAQPVD
jgi:signal transduction histidine kinase